jgi:hypothetical protein
LEASIIKGSQAFSPLQLLKTGLQHKKKANATLFLNGNPPWGGMADSGF